MDHFKPMPPPGFYGQTKLPPKGRRIFSKETREASCLFTDPMPVNLYTLKVFFGSGIPAHPGADHDDLVTGVTQSTRLLPHTSIQRNWQILHQDQDRSFFHKSRKCLERLLTSRIPRIAPARSAALAS